MRRLIAWIVSGLLLSTLASAASPSVPAPLEPWAGWVLHGHEERRCPLLLGQDPTAPASHVCAWPGELTIEAGDDGARFAIGWRIDQVEQRVPLPGDTRLRPVDVRVDGREAAVLLIDGVPTLRLSPGQHRIEGRFAWSRRPERLPLPAAIGLLQLSVDGRTVAAPERDDQHLWLGRSVAQPVGQDALSLRVYRLLADGVPPMLSTELRLEVSGRAREVVLGNPLPAGFVPVALDSPLPAAIDPDGQLRAQLRPGSWRLRLEARSLEVAEAYSPPGTAPPWPAEEIWSVRAAPAIRSVQPIAERPVDPQQVGAPWGESLPSFVLDADDVLQLEQRSRGADPDRAARLHLERTLWLDFADGGATAADTISGSLPVPARLDMAPPWRLEHAAVHGNPLLVTTGAGDGVAGVELRQPQLQLDALARREQVGDALAPGWLSDFDSMSVQLQLPPGWRLLHAGGAADAPTAWVSRWSLLDLFLLALATLVGYRLLGIGFGALVFGYLLLGHQQPGAPLWTLLLVMLAGLLLRLLPAGRLATVVTIAQRLLFGLAVLLALPFAAAELKLALYPQLECDMVGRGGDGGCFDHAAMYHGVAQYSDAEAPVAMEVRAPPAEMLDRVEVSGSRMQAAPPAAAPAPPPPPPRPLDAWPDDAIVQAGPGRPDWRWRVAPIGFDGPVLQGQTAPLWLSPPWATRTWRVLLVLLLAAVLAQLARHLRDAATRHRTPRRTPAAAAAALCFAGVPLLLALATSPVQAEAFPPEPLLDTLRERLLEPPDCAPQCASAGLAAVRVDGERIRLTMELHVGAESAVPLPSFGDGAALQLARLDGEPVALLRRDRQPWLPVERGVHAVELEWRRVADTLDLRFPLPPALLQVRADGYEVGGLGDGRLLGDTLQLVRQAPVDAATPVLRPGSEFPPFVRIVRQLNLGLDWSVDTWVDRIAPAQAGFTLSLPLLEGEQLLGDALPVDDGRVQLAFAAGQRRIHWRSRLPIAAELALTAGTLQHASERWQIVVGPLWHLAHSGVPPLDPDHGSATLSFQPLPTETLRLEIVRPEAVPGDSVAIDRATFDWRPGEQLATGDLTVEIRSTRGGQHVITLPPAAELLDVQLRGQRMPLRLVDGRLALPLLPGDQSVHLQWRQPATLDAWTDTPLLDLGADAANLEVRLWLPDRRWLLATVGGGIGPAVLIWPQLLLMLLLAFALARFAPTPLRFHHWLLLGLGFSTVSWAAAVVVAGWLLLLGWRARIADRVAHWPRLGFALLQLLLAAGSLLALVCLVAAIPAGLLGNPDMQVVGNGVLADPSRWQVTLQWFFDRSSGVLPEVAALSLPQWIYKIAILLWALWLANALIGWLRWGWGSFAAGGYWPPRKPKPVAPAQPPATDA